MRNYCYSQILLAFLLVCNPQGISGFAFSGQHGSSQVLLRAASGEITNAETSTSKGTTKLELRGVLEVVSNPLPSNEKMASFFESEEVRNLLITAGGKRPCEEMSASGDLLEEWKKACEVVGAQTPDESDSPLSVRTGGIDFPGLHLVSKANIGAKLIQTDGSRYEFVLIGDEQTVTGLPPVVWIYNKLTGSGDEKSSSTSSTSSLSTITYEETGDGKTIIKSNASLSVEVNFPSIMLKILPTNKEKAEESGGKALSRTLEKDLKASMEAVEKAYLKYLNEVN